MAGGDAQKQLLTLIHNFATEKSQGERRVVGLKQKIQELRSKLDAENAELEDAKRLKVATEQELKGCEVELIRNDALIQTLEGRICLIRDEISVGESALEALKNEERALRDDFIDKMFELNSKIRKFQETIACVFQEENQIGASPNGGQNVANKDNAEFVRRALETNLSQIISKTDMEQQEYQAEQNIQKQIQQELIDLERKVSLIEAIMKESKELEDLTRQTSDLEATCASLGEELQRRCLCPSCHLDNIEVLNGILQATSEN